NQPTKWQIPLGTIIPANGFLLVWADNQPSQNTNTSPHLHAGFQLNAGGEAIGVYSPGGIAQDTITFGPQFVNVSQGLFPDGNKGSVYFMTNWTPLAPNTLSIPLRITDVSFAPGTVTLTWSAIPGRTYRVLYKDNLEAPAWTALPGDIPATDITASRSDALTTRRFY